MAVILTLLCLFGFLSVISLAKNALDDKWTAERAIVWQEKVGYQAGVNFAPSTAVNELEMFQKETYDKETIDRELGFAQNAGFNTLRVFLHNILWDEGSDDFLNRLDDFLTIANKRGFSTMFVLLDSCWNAYPAPGTQPEPIPGVHNSQWVQCPGYEMLHDNQQFDTLKSYVQGVVKRFSDDSRVLAWDVWNEPNNSGYSGDLIGPLIQKVFGWIREINPAQPLTTPVWENVEGDVYSDFQMLQLNISDVISFHNYEDANGLSSAVKRLRQYDATRPIICTEYMARTAGSHFEPNLQVLKDNNVFAYNWGLVSGRTQTIYPWSTIGNPATEEPTVWFHDVFRSDGTPFNSSEISYIQSVLKKD